MLEEDEDDRDRGKSAVRRWIEMAYERFSCDLVSNLSVDVGESVQTNLRITVRPIPCLASIIWGSSLSTVKRCSLFSIDNVCCRPLRLNSLKN